MLNLYFFMWALWSILKSTKYGLPGTKQSLIVLYLGIMFFVWTFSHKLYVYFKRKSRYVLFWIFYPLSVVTHFSKSLAQPYFNLYFNDIKWSLFKVMCSSTRIISILLEFHTNSSLNIIWFRVCKIWMPHIIQIKPLRHCLLE